jgi:hypothetical protein
VRDGPTDQTVPVHSRSITGVHGHAHPAAVGRSRPRISGDTPVGCTVPKLTVAGSIPVTRSTLKAPDSGGFAAIVRRIVRLRRVPNVPLVPAACPYQRQLVRQLVATHGLLTTMWHDRTRRLERGGQSGCRENAELLHHREIVAHGPVFADQAVA